MDLADDIGHAILATLASSLTADTTLQSEPERIRGGFWAQIWGIRFDNAPAPFDEPLVLRVMPDRTAAQRETTVQTFLADAGYPTPRVLAAGSAPGLGEAYMVMERATGRSPLNSLQLGPSMFRLHRVLTTISKTLAGTARKLHAINPEPLRKSLALLNIDLTEQGGAAAFRARINNAAMSAPGSGFAGLADWFDSNARPTGPDVICHGDLHPFNLLVDTDAAVTVLDWTGATLAPKECDVGLAAGLLRCAPIRVPRPLRPVVAHITNNLAESFIQEYQNGSPLDRSAVDWWEALQHARCLADLTHGRLIPGSIVGPDHPFETSSEAMRRRLHQLTGVPITVPARRSAS